MGLTELLNSKSKYIMQPAMYLIFGVSMALNPLSWIQSKPQTVNLNSPGLSVSGAPLSNNLPAFTTPVPTVNPNQPGLTIDSTPQTAVDAAYTGAPSGGVGTGANSATAPTAPSFTDQFNSALGTLQNAYNNLFSNYDTQTQSKADTTMQNYGLQQQGLNNQFAVNQRQLPAIFMGRGAGSSSYAENAYNDAQNQFDLGNQQINQAQKGDLSNLAQMEAGAKGQGNAALDMWKSYVPNLASYDPYAQSMMLNNLRTNVADVQGQAAGTGGQNQFLSQLQQFAPSFQSHAGTQLQTQLDSLKGSATTQAAKDQIAQGLINTSQVDPNSLAYWKNYWSSLQPQPATG